jgi:hypothetical protein
MPVLLLSWKGDPVEDNEARPANASGLLRKEASVPEVLAAIERALSPRQQLEQALRGEGDVTGQVADLGIVALIECVVAARPDLRLTVEDAADLFEVDIADANQIAVTRTAADGTFTRAERALLQLIGVPHGRFHVQQRSASLRSPIQTPFKSALLAAVSELTTLIEALSSDRVEQVARVQFDDETLRSRLHDSPVFEPIVAGVRRLGLSPTQLLGEGAFSRGELAACLTQLARQGAITGLWAADGKDLLADAAGLHSPLPLPALPPELPAPVTSLDAQSAAAVASKDKPSSAQAASPVSAPTLALAELTSDAELTAEKEPAAAGDDAKISSLADLEQISERAAAVQHVLASDADPTDADRDFDSDPEADFQLHTNPVLVAEIAAARRRGREGLLLAATLVASAVCGYIGALQLETHPALFGSSEAIGARGLDQPLLAANPSSETSVRSGLDASFVLGTVLPYIDTTRGVPVGSDEGLVIFEYVGPLPTPNVEIDGRVLGTPPLSVALAGTPHQLKLWVAGQPTTRTLSVRAGETRVITLPLSKP